MPENEEACQLTPTVDGDTIKTLANVETNIISPLASTPKIQEPDCQTDTHGLSPNPLKLSSSLTDSLKMEPSCVSASVSAMAARLCDCLHFPLLRKRNLLSESQEVLLKVLRERHGAELQENLLKEWQGLSFSIGLTKAAQDHNQAENWIDENAVFHAGQPCCDNQKTTSFRIRGSSHFNWKAGQQPSRSLDQTAEWLSSPMDVSGRLLDDVLRPKHSSHFRMDFESSEASASDNLFIFSPNKYWPETTSAPQLWEDSFNKPSSKEWVSFDSYKGNIMYQSSGVTEEHCWLRRKDGNAQPFSYQAKMPHKRSVERMYIPQKEELFQPDRRSFSLPFPTHIHHHDQPNHFMPFSQLNPPADLMHYPPSHMLERCPAPPLSCLLSPEHWSFPPMKLY
ncbi:proline-rich protein 19 isoform X3 [Echeneis naucrates]|nr:uncharacterized protein LOC115044761 isoform X3 [Echeneis naucrates]